MWTKAQEDALRALHLDPSRHSKEDLVALARHFEDGGSLFAVTDEGRPARKSQEFARKFKRLVQAGELDWLGHSDAPVVTPDERAQRRHFKRQRELWEHEEALRSLAAKLPRHLRLWPPEELWIPDLTTGAYSDLSRGQPPLRWEVTTDGHCRRVLDEQFAALLAHLRSSGQRALLQAFESWQEEGGWYVARCHQLQREITAAVTTAAGLPAVPANSPTPGLLPDFGRTIYRDALAPAPGWTYAVDRSDSPLKLLRLGPGCQYLAWVPAAELERVQARHEALRQRYRNGTLAQDIRAELGGRSADGLGQLGAAVAGLVAGVPIAGTCPACPAPGSVLAGGDEGALQGEPEWCDCVQDVEAPCYSPVDPA